MKLWDFAKKAGTMALNIAAPGSVQLINALLPEDKKLPETATGIDAQSAINSLPADQQAAIKEKELDLQIAQEEGWTERYKAMCEADGQESRAKIVIMLTWALCFEICAFTVWLFANPEMVDNQYLWAAFLVLTGVPARTIGQYFGELRKEQANRQVSISGNQVNGLLNSIFKKS